MVRTGLEWREIGLRSSDLAVWQLAWHVPAVLVVGFVRSYSVAEPFHGPEVDPIEVVPVVVLSQVFPARPSSIPDIRNFVRHCLAESPLTEEGTREVGETVFRALLDAAGPTGSINVAFRIFPEHVEVDVLHSDSQLEVRALAVRALAVRALAVRAILDTRTMRGRSRRVRPARSGSGTQASRPPSPNGCRPRSAGRA